MRVFASATWRSACASWARLSNMLSQRRQIEKGATPKFKRGHRGLKGASTEYSAGIARIIPRVRARRRGHRERAQLAGADVLDRRRQVVEHQVHLSGEEIGERRPGAA